MMIRLLKRFYQKRKAREEEAKEKRRAQLELELELQMIQEECRRNHLKVINIQVDGSNLYALTNGGHIYVTNGAEWKKLPSLEWL